MDIAARGLTDDEAYGTSLPQCCNAHTAPNTRLQGLRSDLSTPQQHHSVDRLERNALVSVRRGDQKRSTPALHASAMIANVYRVQVTQPKTSVVKKRATLAGALVNSGRQ